MPRHPPPAGARIARRRFAAAALFFSAVCISGASCQTTRHPAHDYRAHPPLPALRGQAAGPPASCCPERCLPVRGDALPPAKVVGDGRPCQTWRPAHNSRPPPPALPDRLITCADDRALANRGRRLQKVDLKSLGNKISDGAKAVGQAIADTITQTADDIEDTFKDASDCLAAADQVRIRMTKRAIQTHTTVMRVLYESS